MVDVSQLVSEMHETLSTIHSTIASLSTVEHDEKLDALEQQRDSTLAALRSSFELESDQLVRKRQAERDELTERRRKEDEEREARRRQEDEEMADKVQKEDEERHGQLDGDTRKVEEETDGMMDDVERAAQKMIEEGQAKLAALEEKRRELNRLIDEQLKMPLPSAPTRRRARGGAQMPPAIAANSKPLAPTPALADHHVGNNLVKAHNDAPSDVETVAPADAVEQAEPGDAITARDGNSEMQPEQEDGEKMEDALEQNGSQDVEEEIETEKDAALDGAEKNELEKEDEDALTTESQPTADVEMDQHNQEPAEQPENEVSHDRSENEDHVDDTPAKSSSLLSKMGGAVLSLVGQSHKTESGSPVDERRLSAPGEYPLSEVQSPVDEVSAENGLDGHLHESDAVPHDIGEVENRSLEAPQYDHADEVQDNKPENDDADSESDDVTEEHQEPNEVDANPHPHTLKDDGLQEPSTEDLSVHDDGDLDMQEKEARQDSTTPTKEARDTPHPHPDEGHFDMSGAAAIPGTMTHGMDEPERLVTVDEARAHLAEDNTETPMEPETPSSSKELGPTGQPDHPRGPKDDGVQQAAEPVDHDDEIVESVSTPHDAVDSGIEEQSAPDNEDVQPSPQPEQEDSAPSPLPKRDEQATPTEHANSPIEASSPTIAASDDDGGGHSKSDEAMESQHSAVEGMEPLQGTDHYDAEAGDESPTRDDQGSEGEAEAVAEHSQRPLDADRLDSELGDVTSSDHEVEMADVTPLNDFSRTEIGSEAEAEAEAEAPLWNKLEAGGPPHIEYVPEGENATQADIPEHLQDPAASDEPRTSLDLSVPEIGAGLGEPIDIHETGDEIEFQDAHLAAADPGLHEGIDETPQPVNEAEYQSDYLTANTDSDSQAFITPLQSAGVRSPLMFDERGTSLADELNYAEADEDGHQVWGGDESAATVQGQDDLFDDDYSNGSSGNGEQEAAEDNYDYNYDEDYDEGEEEDVEDHNSEPIKEQVVTHQDDPMDDEVPRTAVIASNPAATVSFASDSGYLSEAPAGSHTADESTDTLASQHHHDRSTPQLQPVVESDSHPETTISPLSLRHTSSPSSTFRGLAESRHAPPKTVEAATAAAVAAARPVTPPPRQRGMVVAEATPSDSDGDSPFMPRDVTHIPWHARHDSMPQSLHSQTTLSSSPSSPIHAALPIDNHEPVIRDSWPPVPASSHHPYLAGLAAAAAAGGGGGGGRPRNDSLLSQSDYEAFASAERKSPLAAKWAARRDSAANITPLSGVGNGNNSARNSVATSSPSSLFQKMRSIFEPPTGGGGGGGGGGASGGAGGSGGGDGGGETTTPPRSRPVSGVWYNIHGSGGSPGRKTGSTGGGGGYGDDDEAGPPADERSALLADADGVEV